MNRDVWGKHAWLFLHTISFAYPINKADVTPKLKKDAENLLESLKSLLPCGICRDHYTKMVETYPPNVDDRTGFSKYLVDIHNKVNERLGKPIISYEKATELFAPNSVIPEELYESSSQKRNWKWWIIAIIFIIVIFIIVYYRKEIQRKFQEWFY